MLGGDGLAVGLVSLAWELECEVQVRVLILTQG